MADTQQQYRGTKDKMPTLLEGQLGFCTDTNELFIGGTEENVLIGGEEYKDKLTATQAEAVTILDASADLSAVITAFNTLINNLKTAGLMK